MGRSKFSQRDAPRAAFGTQLRQKHSRQLNRLKATDYCRWRPVQGDVVIYASAQLCCQRRSAVTSGVEFVAVRFARQLLPVSVCTHDMIPVFPFELRSCAVAPLPRLLRSCLAFHAINNIIIALNEAPSTLCTQQQYQYNGSASACHAK